MIYMLIGLFILIVPSVFGQAEIQPVVDTYYPRLIHADVPFYPPVPATMRFGGTIKIQVTVKEGHVVNTKVLHGTIEQYSKQKNVYTENEKSKLLPYLVNHSLDNLKSWRFVKEKALTFTITYVYRIEGNETPLPENPRVELDLPWFVRVTTKPSKPTINYSNNIPKEDGRQSINK